MGLNMGGMQTGGAQAPDTVQKGRPRP
jgi:hypothetical protein